MSGIHGQILGHLAKRGYEAVHDADMEVQGWEMLPVLITTVVTLLVVASIKYTVGEVIASLAMIESSPAATTTTAAAPSLDDKPPAYADQPDAPVEKEQQQQQQQPLMPAEAEADVELTRIPHSPVTSNIRSTVQHLTRVGGFRARWRGAPVSIVYHALHSLITNCLAGMLGLGLVGNVAMYLLASVGLARLHMVWTHAMIARPSPHPFYRRLVPRDQCRAILLPSFVFALAQQATLILPVLVAFALGLADINQSHVVDAAQHDCGQLAWMSLRFLAVPATAIFVALAVLLPATVTLTRIEALLLPADQATIVPFDRQAIVGSLDITAKGSSRALFVQAWRSFDSSARWRIIKLYVKMVAIQLSVIFVSIHLVIAEMYVIGGERLGLLVNSVSEQMQLAAVDAQQAN